MARISSTAPVMTLDEAGEVTGINEAFERLLGYAQADLVGRSRLPFLSRGHEETLRALVRQAFRGDIPEPLDLPAACSDGAVKDIRWSVALVRDEGEPARSAVAVFGSETGTRRRKRAGAALGEIEDRYRVIFENSGVGLMFTDEKTTIVLVNREFEKATGYSKEEAEGRMSWAALVAREDDLERMKSYNRLRRIDPEFAPAAYTAKIRTRGGEIRDMLLRVTMIPGTKNSLVSFVDMTERRLAEEAIREREEKYRTIVDNMQDVLYRTDLDGNLTFVSPSAAAVFGYSSPEEMIGVNVSREFYSDSGGREPLLERLMREGKVTNYEETLKRRDGTPVEVQINSHLYYDRDGNVSGVEGILRDVTERKRSEKLLRENEERLRGITRNIPGTIFQFYVRDTGEYAMSYVSERLTELLGIEAEMDALFPTFLSRIHKEDKERLLASIRKAVESAVPWKFEGRLDLPSGREMWFEGFATPRQHGDRLVYDGILLDITARKRAEEALEKRMVALTRPLDDAQEIAFEELFNIGDIQRLQDDFARATGVASIITHTDGTPITVPSCFCRLCIGIIRKTEKGRANCYKSDAALGRLSREGPTVQQCMSGGLWDAGAGISVGGRHIANWLIGQVRDETQTEERMREYAREIGVDEEEFLRAFREVPAMSRERFDQVARALFTLANQLSTLAYQNVQQARFITERRKAEEERRKLEERLFLSEKLKAIGQLAGGVAHDFNNLLMGILGNASLVQMEFDPGHPSYRRLSQIEEHVKRGANLTRQLLGFARGGKYEVKTLSPNDLVRRSAQLFLETRKGIEAAFLLRDDVRPVEADAGQIEQVLLNIYINAGHAMPGGGSLEIRTSNVTLSESDARAFETKPGEYVKISITDTGTGMDRETLSRIFDPFFTTKSEQGGTGLGLASAYGIVRNHGGAINAHSEPGHGSTFNIYLPAADRALEKEIAAKPGNELLRGSGGILLVDDEPMILDSAAGLLESLGYSVYRASSGQEAAATYREKRDGIDLVILDMILPGMGGSEVLRALKEIDPGVRVVLSSGYGLQDDVRSVMEAGCCAFVQKPYKFADLSRIIRQVISRPRDPR